MEEQRKRYSARILPYLAGKLTEQGFITFLQRLTHARRHKITHMHTLHLQADGYTNTRAFTNCFFSFFLSFLKRFTCDFWKISFLSVQLANKLEHHHLKCHYCYYSLFHFEEGCAKKGFCNDLRTRTSDMMFAFINVAKKKINRIIIPVKLRA